MGFTDFFRRKALTASPAVIEAAQTGQLNLVQTRGGTNANTAINEAWLMHMSATYAYLYEHQPSVRRVIDYIADNVGQLGLKLYERVSDTDRRGDYDHPAYETVEHPNSLGPGDQFIRTFVSEYLVHSNAYAVKFRANNGGPRILIPVPAPAVAVSARARYAVDFYRLFLSDGSYVDVPPDDMIHWHGYNPSDPRIGISKLETLRQLLSEEAAAQASATELYKSGLSQPGVVERPLEAPDWTEKARANFQESFANQVKAGTRRIPVLEEGMTFAKFGVSPKDAEVLDSRRFTDEQVASLFGMKHVPPEGEDERRQFYADVLPPLTEALASQLCFSILEAEYGETSYYYEFNLNEKLRGEPEKRFAAITAATGGPWLLRNEARAYENLPAVDDGDELIVPLNVIVGDNPRPAANVMPPQDPNGPPQDGSHREASLNGHTDAATARLAATNGKALVSPRPAQTASRRDSYASDLQAVLTEFYTRQENAIVSKGTRKAFETDRWNRELAADLRRHFERIVEREGDVNARRFGMIAFDTREVDHYLDSKAEGNAREINEATRAALADGEKPADVFERARSSRAPTGAMGMATALAAFAMREAANQSADSQHRQKTWVVTSSNSEHPELDGESVPLNATFSNGTDGPPADHPGCECVLDII